MTERFDAVIVGSGFGGSVMAYRLAKAGKRVCLLERGKAYPPGSFSRAPLEVNNNFWDPSAQHYGLFDIWSFRKMGTVVSAGLGGGSLIYANVLIRKDTRWFTDPLLSSGAKWPVTRAQLDPHYDAVEAILRPSTYPTDYQRNNKTSAMRQAALDLGIPVTLGEGDPSKPQWYLPPLAVTFNLPDERPMPGRVFDPGHNYHGAPRETCRLCGECDIGCNYGAKNTLDFTYITHAKDVGADVRPLTEVKEFVQEPDGGYRITCVAHDIATATTPGVLPPQRTYDILARKVILSAGTLGSTYLLLKMRKSFPNISKTLGSRFSGNGDLLMFVTRCVDRQKRPIRMNASRAPVITSTFRFPDTVDNPNEGRGFYLQDAGYPLFVDYIWEMLDWKRLFPSIVRVAWSFVRRWITGNLGGEINRELSEFAGGTLSSTSMPLLGMGRDVADGKMSTRTDPKTKVEFLQLDWNDERSKGYLVRAVAQTRAIARALGGRYTVNPLTLLFNNLITVHPLGGCPMATTDAEGVVDPCGRVFGYTGLYVADGSIMPGPVGANPSLTIAALADRIADSVLSDPW